MKGAFHLFAMEDKWVTRMGAWFPGERVVFRGRDLFQELKDLSWMGLLLYGITGRLFDDRQIRLFEGIWTLCTSYPDPRIWNNRVAALAGTARSTATLSIAAATAVSEATIYGRRPDIRAIDFLMRAKQRLDQGEELKEIVTRELKQHRGILGYGRPVTRKDERVEPVMTMAKQLGFADGAYIKLAFAVEDILLTGRWRLHMNIAAVLAALAADQGLSREDYYRFMVLSFSAGMFPCYIEAHDKPEGSFYPFRCSRLQYEGVPRRRWHDRVNAPAAENAV